MNEFGHFCHHKWDGIGIQPQLRGECNDWLDRRMECATQAARLGLVGLQTVPAGAVIAPMQDYPTKITFGEMRAQRPSWSFARTTNALTTSRWTRRDGRTRCVCRMSSRGSPARPAASEADHPFGGRVRPKMGTGGSRRSPSCGGVDGRNYAAHVAG